MTVKLSDLIKKLQDIKDTHGDLDLYERTDWLTVIPFNHDIKVCKVFTRKGDKYEDLKGELDYGGLNSPNDELEDVDLTQPIVKGVVF